MCYFRLIYFGDTELHTKRQKEGFHIKLNHLCSRDINNRISWPAK